MPINPALLKKKLRYILRATFSADMAAPLPASLPIDVGGPLTVEDASNVLSQTGGVLRVNGTPAAISGLVNTATYARVCGRAFFGRLVSRTTVNSGMRWGWGTSASFASNIIDHSYAISSTTSITAQTAGTGLVAFSCVGSTDLAIIQRGTGAFYFAKLAAETAWTLVCVQDNLTSTLNAKLTVPAVAQNLDYDNFRIIDLAALDSRFASDEAYATSRLATNSAGDTITQTADAWIDQTITAATGVDKDLYVRWTDDNNCWIVRQNQAGSTVKLIEKVAGVETVRGSTATTFTNGTSYRMTAICGASVIRVFTNMTLKITYSSASFQATATTAKAPSAGTELKSYPLSLTPASTWGNA